jgi:tetratricopeptide (TPR) repeat protein
MIIDDIFKTRTLARIFAAQGQFEKAASIYRHLIGINPDQPDLKAELEIIKIKNAALSGTPKKLDSLYIIWIEAVFEYHLEQSA